MARALDLGHTTVERTRKRCVEEPLGARHERPRPGPGGRWQLTAKHAAPRMAVASPLAPAGQARWTRTFLADNVVE
jgi:hypothetical protein